ncbi:cell wall-binding repeat-containing protein [Ornithinimicrobium pratense]|uniref:Polysaccharide deacetylase family protein n=1 Tax=Ornithinimicrobium pratense TaxID=2593973 RepID=A0A5J6V3M3_9MICO|nr:cell wall-binding repeat-containing protein [Ornithinimicrobium pratense]QFG68315.1 polysaccharide deacetylase family protein [Ornithinimicrobium pratense]
MERSSTHLTTRLVARLTAVLAGAALAVSPALVQAQPTPPAEQAAVQEPAGDLSFRVERLEGGDRYRTAARVSARFFTPRVPVAYVASGVNYPDALSAGPAAESRGAPVLFVRPGSVPEATAAELRRLQPGRIIVVGGSSAVNDGVLTELRALTTGTVTRLAGPDRYGTSVRISQDAFPGGADIVWVATGQAWPDALAAGAAAAVQDGPVLLTGRTSVPSAVRAEIARLKPSRILVAGAGGAVSDAVVQDLRSLAPTERISGTDRYATSVAISRRVFGTNRPGVHVATGHAYPDALAAVPTAGTTRGPVLLTRPGSLPGAVATELRRITPRTAYLLGGRGSMSLDIDRAVQRERGICWAGPTYPGNESQKVLTTVPGTTGKKVAFTLDMGGRLEGAEQIVDYLIANQVCTTFFPTSLSADSTQGRKVMAKIAAHPELFELGNHTVHHCDLVRGGGGSPTAAPCNRTMTDAFVRAELATAEPALERLAKMPIQPLWRPPYGAHDARVRSLAASVGYPVTVMWGRDTIDWDPATTAAQIVSRTTSPLPPSGTIVLAHLGGYKTSEALPQIVSTLRGAGYTLTTVSDMRDG